MSARRFLLFLALLPLAGCQQTTTLPTGSLSLETHYSPAENLEALDRNAFEHAHSSIDLCAYSLTDHALAQALEDAAQRGVHIRIYLDRSQTAGELSRETRYDQHSRADEESESDTGVLQQLAATPNVELRIKHSKTLMHLKSYVIDNQLLRSGSANFSPTGEKRQDNDLTFTRDRQDVQRFESNFRQIWSRPDNDPLTLASNSGF